MPRITNCETVELCPQSFARSIDAGSLLRNAFKVLVDLRKKLFGVDSGDSFRLVV